MLAFHFTTLGSTNDAALELASLNRGRGVLVSARTQTRGRGRQGRAWQSPAGGAWFSVAWPAAQALDAYAAAPLAVGLAVAQTLETCFRVGRLSIKWPNDVLLHGRKLVGILCETQVTADDPPTLILGVGVNVNVDTSSLSPTLRLPAISLHEALGHAAPLQPIIGACGKAIAGAMRRLERTGLDSADVAAIERRLAWRGEQVTLHVGDRAVQGVLDGVEPDGRLRLITTEGEARFRSGEVGMLRHNDLLTIPDSLMNEVLA